MADRIYSVTGTVIKGHHREFEVLVSAKNAKDAKKTALMLWGDSEKKIGHLFHLSAHRTNKAATIPRMMWHKTGERTEHGWVTYV